MEFPHNNQEELIMVEVQLEPQTLAGYSLLILGFVILIINHATILIGNPWLIPEFLRLY